MTYVSEVSLRLFSYHLVVLRWVASISLVYFATVLLSFMGELGYSLVGKFAVPFGALWECRRCVGCRDKGEVWGASFGHFWSFV